MKVTYRKVKMSKTSHATGWNATMELKEFSIPRTWTEAVEEEFRVLLPDERNTRTIDFLHL